MESICITYFDDESFKMWKEDKIKKLHYFRKVKKYGKDSIVLLVNKTDKTIVGFCKLESDFEEKHLLDVDTFSDKYSKYNKYEANIHSYKLFDKPILLEDIGKFCGVKNDVALQNISKLTVTSFAKPYYKGDDSELVIEKFITLIKTWL